MILARLIDTKQAENKANAVYSKGYSPKVRFALPSDRDSESSEVFA